MEMKKNDALREQVLRSSGVDVRKCMRCGKCTATCPAFDQMDNIINKCIYTFVVRIIMLKSNFYINVIFCTFKI